mmetsp:Transcript_989/g.1711  ORF Transcript_989/g.1711 Transcript_989/m.1711 type:complete len:234 (+) Transcript_989:473-1174(+)
MLLQRRWLDVGGGSIVAYGTRIGPSTTVTPLVWKGGRLHLVHLMLLLLQLLSRLHVNIVSSSFLVAVCLLHSLQWTKPNDMVMRWKAAVVLLLMTAQPQRRGHSWRRKGWKWGRGGAIGGRCGCLLDVVVFIIAVVVERMLPTHQGIGRSGGWCRRRCGSGGIVLWVVPSRGGGGSCFDCFAVLLVNAADVILVVLITPAVAVIAIAIAIAIAVLVGCRLTHQSSTDAKSLVV